MPIGCHLVKWFRGKCGSIQPDSTVGQALQQLEKECFLRSEARHGQAGGLSLVRLQLSHMSAFISQGSTDARLTDTGRSWKRRIEDCSAHRLLWTTVAGIDTDQLRFSCHTDIFGVSCFFGLIHRHRAVPGGMDGATVSVLSLEQLITALLLIVNELCHRFRIPLSSASSVPLRTTPDLEPPSGSPIPARGSCDAKCRWCDLPCGRAKPGHTGHSCYTHRHWHDGSFHGWLVIGTEC